MQNIPQFENGKIYLTRWARLNLCWMISPSIKADMKTSQVKLVLMFALLGKPR